jgi:putative phosphoribosyl transferase
MRFPNRLVAARALAERLARFRGTRPLVLGIPRGAVPIARVVAEALDGDLDVVLVHKIGAPGNPEFAIGSVSETGEYALGAGATSTGAGPDYVAAEVASQVRALRERRARLPSGRQPDPADRVVIVVDDGVATGTTMLAALTILRRHGPRRLVAAMAVAPPETVRRLEAVADEVVCLFAPPEFRAVGQFFDDFGPVTDDEVVAELTQFRRGRESEASPAESVEEVEIAAAPVVLRGDLAVPAAARGLVLFAHGSGSSRKSPRNGFVAAQLRARGLATLLLDLLTEEEDLVRGNRFDIDLLTRRLAAATAWAQERPDVGRLPLGYCGASTGAACALRAAVLVGDGVRAVVSRGGRPDLALSDLPRVRAPTLLIVGGDDTDVLALNRAAFAQLACEKELAVVPGATHLFEETGTLEKAASLAAAWFARHLGAAR